jgi:hypothetical protein
MTRFAVRMRGAGDGLIHQIGKRPSDVSAQARRTIQRFNMTIDGIGVYIIVAGVIPSGASAGESRRRLTNAALARQQQNPIAATDRRRVQRDPRSVDGECVHDRQCGSARNPVGRGTGREPDHRALGFSIQQIEHGQNARLPQCEAAIASESAVFILRTRDEMRQIGVRGGQEPDVQVRYTSRIAQKGWQKFVGQGLVSKTQPKQIGARPHKRFDDRRRENIFEEVVDRLGEQNSTSSLHRPAGIADVVNRIKEEQVA